MWQVSDHLKWSICPPHPYQLTFFGFLSLPILFSFWELLFIGEDQNLSLAVEKELPSFSCLFTSLYQRLFTWRRRLIRKERIHDQAVTSRNKVEKKRSKEKAVNSWLIHNKYNSYCSIIGGLVEYLMPNTCWYVFVKSYRAFPSCRELFSLPEPRLPARLPLHSAVQYFVFFLHKTFNFLRAPRLFLSHSIWWSLFVELGRPLMITHQVVLFHSPFAMTHVYRKHQWRCLVCL